MSTENPAPGQRNRLARPLAAYLLLAALAACTGGSDTSKQAGGPPPTLEGKKPSGFVELREVQVAYIGNAGGGSGILTYQGKTYPFKIAGIGVGGIGASKLDAEGEVYDLKNLAEFAGAYGQGQYGEVAGTESIGDMWLENEHHVILHLKAKREGLMLAVGADAIDVRMGG